MNRTRCRLKSLSAPLQLGTLVVPSAGAAELSAFNNPADVGGLHPATEQGRTPRRRQEVLPPRFADQIGDLTWDWDPQELRQRVAALYSSLHAGEVHQPTADPLDVAAHITGVFLQSYTAVRACMQELQKRRPAFSPKSLLDVGFGPATGVLAAQNVWEQPAEYVKAVIIGDHDMKQKAKKLAGSDEHIVYTDQVPSTSSPQTFDLIVCTNQLHRNGDDAESAIALYTKQMSRLLNPDGVLLFVERGDPLGFESVATARRTLLANQESHESGIDEKGDSRFSVVAPCSHDKPCPLSIGLGLRSAAKNKAKFNWCRFYQNIQRPQYTLELKRGQYLAQKWEEGTTRGTGGASLRGNGRPGGKNYETASFSWVAIQKAPRLEPAETAWPRILQDPMKRHRHVLMEVCTDGAIQHWTIPKSQGRQAYNDARKARAMDLWPLDAKVKQNRGGISAETLEKLAKLAKFAPVPQKRARGGRGKGSRAAELEQLRKQTAARELNVPQDSQAGGAFADA